LVSPLETAATKHARFLMAFAGACRLARVFHWRLTRRLT
jgi:hypothetical protein